MTRDLVERARRGDHDAFAELAGAAISRLDATAWLMLRDADRATDAVQNALVRAWRDLPTLRDPDRFDAWLHRLVVNACIDEIRRDPAHVTSTSTSPTSPNRRPVADAASAIADRDQLERGFAVSTPRSGRSSSCITTSTCRCRRSPRRCGIPLGTTKSRLYRGLRQMRAALDADARPGPDIREGRPA